MTDDEALLNVAPEFASVPPARREFFLEQMRLEVNEALGQYGLVLATAHELTLSNRGGAPAAAGAVISESEGELSRSYANESREATPGNAYWTSTTYGQRYLAQIQRNILVARNRMVA
jgi:hypothetical protein